MEIGAKIKYLRLERNVTQEALAEYLGVSPQAVSKWERGAAAPDIGLLPALSVFFGVRIDDFFALSDRARLDRINRMMEHEGFLSQADFDYADNLYFSPDAVKSMSPAEIRKNYDKILTSMEKWN